MVLTGHFSRSESTSTNLRIGVLLDSNFLAEPFADVLDHIKESNYADIALRIYNTGGAKVPTAPRGSFFQRTVSLLSDSKRRKSIMWTLYDKVDARFAADSRRLLAPRDISNLLSGIPEIQVTPISKGFTHRFPLEVVEEIKSYKLDVILRFGFNIIKGEILNVPRYGIWSYHHGDNDFYRGGPPYFWELVEQNPLSGVMLQILNEELDAGTVLCKGLAPTEPTLLVSKNRVQPYLLGTTFAIRKLFELHRGGMAELVQKSVAPYPYLGKQKIYRSPGNGQVARFLGMPLVRKALQRPFRRPTVDHWRLAFRIGRQLAFQNGSALDLNGFRWCESPRGRFYADPFLWASEGRMFCFFEDYSYLSERGRISCGEVTPECELVDVRPVLEPNYHLSYPFIFEDSGEIFLVPESAQNGTIDLYRATSFPYQWEHVRTMVNAPGLDSTILGRDGLYWMFTSLSEPSGSSLQLVALLSSSLTGKFEFHHHTPITADARFARSAGRVFEQEGMLIRPSQDSSGTYGRAIHFRKIVELTPKSYIEEPLATLNPPTGFSGLHSYNRIANVETIDGKSKRLLASVSQQR
jgi:hypothetical protein